MSLANDLAPEERVRRNKIVRNLVSRLDDHSPGELAHSDRVAVYSVATGSEMGFDPQTLLDIRYAAELHGIGKLGFAPALLKDRSERMRLVTHVTIAGAYLPDEPFLAEARVAIRHHHERWDGSGYPDQLSGDEIPAISRILAASEALDVMLNGNFDRERFSVEVARSAMLGLSGSWFDPEVVENLLAVQPLVQPLTVR
jgi:HD-GYP domain-containing protein (c-di-GMP phosphodiesterase class II)